MQKKGKTAKHHTLLHFEAQAKPQSSTSLLNTNTEAAVAVPKANSVAATMLFTLEVYIIDIFEQAVKTRAVLDSGSQLNLISNKLASRLAIKRCRINHKLTGIVL